VRFATLVVGSPGFAGAEGRFTWVKENVTKERRRQETRVLKGCERMKRGKGETMEGVNLGHSILRRPVPGKEVPSGVKKKPNGVEPGRQHATILINEETARVKGG